jgi:gluconate 2-dehydrogenase alpha chain
MGKDAQASVVNQYCQSHEVPNLFVVGGSVFPTYCGLEPTETIQALAFLTADFIKREARRGGSLARYL